MWRWRSINEVGNKSPHLSEVSLQERTLADCCRLKSSHCGGGSPLNNSRSGSRHSARRTNTGAKRDGVIHHISPLDQPTFGQPCLPTSKNFSVSTINEPFSLTHSCFIFFVAFICLAFCSLVRATEHSRSLSNLPASNQSLTRFGQF